MSYMFPSLLNYIPKNRLDMVEDLEIPYVKLKPYVWTDPEDIYSITSDSTLTDSWRDYERRPLSTDSSIPLSRAMTDSDIDYGFYKRYRNCYYSDPFDHMRAAMDAFPPEYRTSLSRYILSKDLDADLARRRREEEAYADELADSRRRYNEVWRLRMKRLFDEDNVYAPDDPSLWELQDAIRQLDMKKLEADLANIRARPYYPLSPYRYRPFYRPWKYTV